MALSFHTLDVFTEQRFGGNPLAVVLGGEQLSTERMQTLAREFNLSETVFVLPPDNPDALKRLRIFTPTRELPFAGHPTVGAACLLAELGLADDGADLAIVLQEEVGVVPVRIRREKNRPLFAQLTTAVLPSFGPPPPSADAIASILGIDATDIEMHSDAPRAASCGVPYLLVPLKTRRALAQARPNRERWSSVMADYWAHEIFIYAIERNASDAPFRTRMFAPELGIGEDPATGSAAAAFCGALADRHDLATGTLRWTLEQGYEMGRPSQLFVEADKRDGRMVAIRVGGYALRVSEGRIEVE